MNILGAQPGAASQSPVALPAGAPARLEIRVPRRTWPRSVFALPARVGQSFELDLVGRLPDQIDSEGSSGWRVTVAVNGRELGTVEIGPSWSRAGFRVDAAKLKAGLNRVSIDWPVVATDGAGALDRAVRRLERGVAADLHPVFGEIASLRARPSPRPF